MLHRRLARAFQGVVAPLLRRPPLLQVAALCMRHAEAGSEVLLITSRGRKRWILPKGWPEAGRTLAEAAALEAWEEGGVRGRVAPEPLGRYRAQKGMGGGATARSVVHVFRLDVEEIRDDFPEARQRRRRWLAPGDAAQLVDEPELRAMLADLR